MMNDPVNLGLKLGLLIQISLWWVKQKKNATYYTGFLLESVVSR